MQYQVPGSTLAFYQHKKKFDKFWTARRRPAANLPAVPAEVAAFYFICCPTTYSKSTFMYAKPLLSLLFPALLLSFGSGCESAPDPATDEADQATVADTDYTNRLTPEEEAEGWKLLFDGQTTGSWRNYGVDTIGRSWQVQDGALTLIPADKSDWQTATGGDIVTPDQYEDFELALEWKIADCGNSGIMYYVVESEQFDHPWQTGPEMQVLDNSCHPDAKIEKHRAGDLYDLISVSEETVKPAGEWNSVRILSRDGQVEHWLNGTRVVTYDRNSEAYRELIAGSKFAEMQGFGTAERGHIALQDHGDRVAYRNIKIREL